jgi:hypothetical protein
MFVIVDFVLSHKYISHMAFQAFLDHMGHFHGFIWNLGGGGAFDLY